MWSSQSLRIAARNASADIRFGVTAAVLAAGLGPGLASCATTGTAVVTKMAAINREAIVEGRNVVMR
jgi:hypothetical protein